jgi:peptidoglycan/LPS O-acetylase OafA/YrhL
MVRAQRLGCVEGAAVQFQSFSYGVTIQRFLQAKPSILAEVTALASCVSLDNKGSQMKNSPKTGYLPTLDGWRALSIISVMLTHDVTRRIGYLNTGWFVRHGAIGVDVFFAISGILICSKLLDEEKRNKEINLTSFYLRRAFRILPAAYLYLATITVMSHFDLIVVGYRELIGCLLFFRNYTGPLHLTSVAPGWYTGHFWSLAVEEHFYFLLPAILLIRKQRLWILSIVCVLIALHCGLQLTHRDWDLISHHTDVRLNSILFPAVLTIIAHERNLLDRYKQWFRFWPILFVAIVMMVTFLQMNVWTIQSLAILLPCMIYGSILNSHTPWGRFLECAPLRFVGRLSYSLYLWQQLFDIDHLSNGFHQLGRLQDYPFFYFVTFVAALTSYFIIERPLVRLGHRLSTPNDRRQSSQLAKQKEVAAGTSHAESETVTIKS